MPIQIRYERGTTVFYEIPRGWKTSDGTGRPLTGVVLTGGACHRCCSQAERSGTAPGRRTGPNRVGQVVVSVVLAGRVPVGVLLAVERRAEHRNGECCRKRQTPFVVKRIGSNSKRFPKTQTSDRRKQSNASPQRPGQLHIFDKIGVFIKRKLKTVFNERARQTERLSLNVR